MSGVHLELDEDLVTLLKELDQPVELAAREFIVLELYRRKTITSGKAATLLGMERFDFIRYPSELGIPFFDMSEADWEAELALLQTIRLTRRSSPIRAR